jgi:hypothetical protein
VALGLLAGCGGAPSTTKSGAAVKSRGEDPLEAARDVLRKATDAGTIRDALHLLNAHVSREPEAAARLQKIKEERDRALPPDQLGKQYCLDGDELAEVTATSFRPLDAYYLAQAFELRDAARALQVQELPRLQQAEQAFAWVMRQVILTGRGDDLVPPTFVLNNGQGTAPERALVFLGLLHQLGLDGCLVAVPGPAPDQPRFWATGVLIEEKGRGEIYLFDTRLGLPLPGPGGKGIATLAQLRKDPQLLGPLTADKALPYDVTPEEALTAQVYLAPQLSALAPRMKYLEDLLSAFDRINLAVDPAGLLKRFGAATGSEVRVWNQLAAVGKAPPVSPVRALRLFVPPEEGGLDRTGKVQRAMLEAIPWAEVARVLRDVDPAGDLPAPASEQLRRFAAELYKKYALDPHDYLVRGRLDETTRRLVQGLSVVDETRMPEPEFQKAVTEWRERVKQTYLALINHEPGAQRAVDALWYGDQHLHALLAPTSDEGDLRKLPKKILTFITVRAVAAPMRNEASYLLALCWQEKAERFQVQRERHRQGGKDDERAAKRAADAWLNVQDWWQKYADRYPFSLPTLHQQVSAGGDFWRANDFSHAVQFWERAFRDLRAACHGRLLQADGLRKAGKSDAADALLKSLAAELGTLQEDADVKKTFTALVTQADRLRRAAVQTGGPVALLEDVHQRLRGLERDLGPDGSFASARAAALYRLKRSEK